MERKDSRSRRWRNGRRETQPQNFMIRNQRSESEIYHDRDIRIGCEWSTQPCGTVQYMRWHLGSRGPFCAVSQRYGVGSSQHSSSPRTHTVAYQDLRRAAQGASMRRREGILHGGRIRLTVRVGLPRFTPTKHMLHGRSPLLV